MTFHLIVMYNSLSIYEKIKYFFTLNLPFLNYFSLKVQSESSFYFMRLR